MYGTIENTVPWGSTTATEYLIEDWVYDACAEHNEMSIEEFDKLPIKEQSYLIGKYLHVMEQPREI